MSAIRVAVFIATTIFAIPVLLRDHSRRVLAIEAIAVLAIDALIIGLLFLFVQAIQAKDPPARQAHLSELFEPWGVNADSSHPKLLLNQRGSRIRPRAFCQVPGRNHSVR